LTAAAATTFAAASPAFATAGAATLAAALALALRYLNEAGGLLRRSGLCEQPHHGLAIESGEKSVVRRVEVLVTSLIRRATAGHAVFVGTTGKNEWPAGCPYASRTICSKPNYFVQQSNLERIRDFVNVLLVSIGVPQVAPVAPNPALQGYSWPAFVDVCIGTDGQAQGRVGPRPGEAEGRRPGIQGNTTSLYASPFDTQVGRDGRDRSRR
jgi:hypothetical protein